MNNFLFLQVTSTLVGVLIVGSIVSLINKKYKLPGIISIVLAIFILLIGIIAPISIVISVIVAIIMGGLGAFLSSETGKKRGSAGN